MSSPKYPMVWPLADFLAEEMEERGWTCIDVALRMPGCYEENVALVNMILAISSTGGPDNFKLGEGTAAAFAKAFGVSEQLISGLHKVWLDNPEARQAFDCPEHLFAGIEITDPPDRSDA